MADNGMFRTAVFGGYNRDDVDEYIQTLEKEMDSVRELHQKEKEDLIRRAEESESELTRVRYELEAARSDVRPASPAADGAGQEDALRELEEELGRVIGAPVREPAPEAEKEELASLRESLRELEEENQSLKEKLGKQGQEDELFDYETVRKIMEEARNNAWIIEKEARQQADAILESARQKLKEEEDEQRHRIASRINTQLEEKGIQLMAAKYKIEQYIKEISSAQQGLYLLNSRMEKMVKDMPVRLDDYWEVEEYRQLEVEEGKEKTNEKPETESSRTGSGDKIAG